MPHSLLTHPVRDQLYFMGFLVWFINMRTCNCLHGLLLLLCLMNRRCNWPVNRLPIEEKHRQEEFRSCPKWRVVVYVLRMIINQIPITRNAMTTLEKKIKDNLELWSNNLKFWRNGAIASNWTTLGSPQIMLYLLNGKSHMLYRIDQKMFRLDKLFLICFKFRH
jgi:hypothetical protein